MGSFTTNGEFFLAAALALVWLFACAIPGEDRSGPPPLPESLLKTAPSVSSTSPPDGALGISTRSTITVTFSKTMDSSTITPSTFLLADSSGNFLSGTVSSSGTNAALTPSVRLSQNAVYTATITAEARDAVGNALDADYSWSFTTGKDED